MSEPKMKARLWLPWFYKKGDEEVRLTSDDVYDALGEARKTLLFTMHQRDSTPEMIEKKEREIAILQTVEDGLRSMFNQALKETPRLEVPKKGGKR